jgi:hypothetical protein
MVNRIIFKEVFKYGVFNPVSIVFFILFLGYASYVLFFINKPLYSEEFILAGISLVSFSLLALSIIFIEIKFELLNDDYLFLFLSTPVDRKICFLSIFSGVSLSFITDFVILLIIQLIPLLFKMHLSVKIFLPISILFMLFAIFLLSIGGLIVLIFRNRYVVSGFTFLIWIIGANLIPLMLRSGPLGFDNFTYWLLVLLMILLILLSVGVSVEIFKRKDF